MAEIFPQLKRLGYSGIELYVRDPKQIDNKELEKALHENKLELAAVSTSPIVADDKLTFTSKNRHDRKEAVERVKAVIDFAVAYQAPVIIGKVRGNLNRDAKETSFAWMREALRETGEYAAEQGVELAIEPQNEQNINVLNTTAEVLELIEDIELPSLKVMLDTYHLYITEASIDSSIRLAQEVLIFMHAADENRALTGEGILDFEAVLKTLHHIGYTGYISMEIKQQPTSEQAAQMAIEHLRTVSLIW